MKTLKAINAWCEKPVTTTRINHYANETIVWTLFVLILADMVLHSFGVS